MSHLTTESLARLVDGPSTITERAHLESCGACRAVLDTLHVQTAALAVLPAHTPPPAAWDAIAARVRDGEHRGTLQVSLLRIAAAIGLFAIGAATQASIAGDRGARAGGESGSDPAIARGAAAMELVSAGAPTTMEDATARLRIAETIYTRALLDYAAMSSPQPPRDAVARLATLEAIVLTTRAALERAPADPLINTYHLAAQAERESLLGQLRRRSEAGRWY